MVGFIDDHRDQYGVEPICAVLPIAPSTYFRYRAQQREPARRSARAQRDDELRAEIQRVWDDHHQVYGPRKVWRQLRREQVTVARCTVERLMRDMALRGAGRGIGWIDAHLLASAIVGRVRLWTAEPRLAAVATELRINYK